MDGLEKQEVVSDKATEKARRSQMGNSSDSATRRTLVVRTALGNQPPLRQGGNEECGKV